MRFHGLFKRTLRTTVYRPVAEGLEVKTLPSAVLGWSGGNGGNTSSMITPANISSLTEQYSDLLDGQILAEPLCATVNITTGPHQGMQTVVFVATERNSVYAINSSSGQVLWQSNLLGPGETTLPASITHSTAIYPEIGITSTPLIDPSTDTIYVVTTESYRTGKVTYYSESLHALNMSDGAENPGSPVVIADTGYVRGKPVSFVGPSVRGTGAGSVRGLVRFYVPRQLQRPGLALDGDQIVIAFGSHHDTPPYHGWLLAYDENSLQLDGVFNDTPNGSDGGIWNSGAPIQVDSQEYLYTETGNGTFDTRLNRAGFPSGGDYGDSVIKLALDPGYKGPNGFGFRVVDYFTPHDQLILDKSDLDPASSGVLILPDGAGGPTHPDLLLASGKQGTIYVIDRNNMGKYHSGSDDIVQELRGALSGSYDTPASFGNTYYYVGPGDAVKAFTLTNGQLVQTGASTQTFPYPGANAVVSSDGSSNGIVWLVSAAGELVAYNALDLGDELWSASISGYSHFETPTVTDDGHVEVGGGDVLTGFGLGDSG